jgi:hypothetical protein
MHHRGRLVRSFSFLVLIAIGASCSTDSPGSSSPTDSAVASPSPPACPNFEGMACLGELDPGTYTTVVFDPTLTYTVDDGWTNFEDTPGNFLLVPARGDLPGVNAGTSDFIGIYTSVAAEAYTCDGSILASDVGRTPDDIARWLALQDGLTATKLQRTHVGGLDGVVLDVSLDDGGGLHCPGYEPAYYPVLLGVSPSHLDHGLIPGLTWRLYLLNFRGGTLAIEVNDVGGGGRHLAEYSALVKALRFSV